MGMMDRARAATRALRGDIPGADAGAGTSADEPAGLPMGAASPTIVASADGMNDASGLTFFSILGNRGRTAPMGEQEALSVPAVLRAWRQGDESLLNRAVKENTARVVERLRGTEQILIEPQRRGTLKIVGARHDLDDGNVEFFE